MYRANLYHNGLMIEVILKFPVIPIDQPPFHATLTNFKIIRTNRKKLAFSEENNSEITIHSVQIIEEIDANKINNGDFQFIE